jgi:hypothetical protein
MDGFTYLGLGTYTCLMTKIQVMDWGRTVLVNCVYHPEYRQPFRIVFSNCEEIKWYFNKDEIESCLDDENILDIIDFQITQEQKKQKALFFAHLIEIIIICEKIKLEKNWSID